VHHLSTEKPKALVGSEPRTELEQATEESNSTSTPLPTTMYSFLKTKVDPYHPSIGFIKP